MQITKINNANDVTELVNINEQKLQQLNIDEREIFKENFLNVCSDSHLTSNADAQEIFNVAFNATKSGLNIAPSAKQLYILPFNGKNGRKLEIVLRAEAIQKIIAQKGYFVEFSHLWSIDERDVLESELSFAEQARLNKNNEKFIDNNFLGFYFKITYLKDDALPIQHCVVGRNYLATVTKQLQSKEHKLANWKHKAFRKMLSEVNLENGFKSSLENIVGTADSINYGDAIDAEEVNNVSNTNDNEFKIDYQQPVQQESVQQQETAEDKISIIKNIYKNSEPKKRVSISNVMTKYSDYKSYNLEQLDNLIAELQSL